MTVFGDYCLDAYWIIHADDEEISVETGLPVRRIASQRYSLGGAGSALANLVAMGVGQVRAVGIAGNDVFGSKLRDLLQECGANTEGLLPCDSWQTMVYAKPYLAEHEESRLDFGMFNELSGELQQALLAQLEAAVAVSDAVILNQQVPAGLALPEMIASINAMIARHPAALFLVDARHHAAQYEGAALKLNLQEAASLLGESEDGSGTEARAKNFALRIHQRTGKPAFLTRGELGLVVAANGAVTLIPGLQVFERTDAVGAGDAAVAALAASLAAGVSPVEAAVLANIAAMITVRKLQMTGTASAAEILTAAEELNYVFCPELAEDLRLATYLPGTEIEVVGDLPADLDIRHCIFDHDGTLSTLRQGWEQIMEPMMIGAILGKRLNSVDRATLEMVTELVRQFIDRTTGVQTLAQMKGLAGLVRQCGFVPESEILDEHGYKHLYNLELLKMVEQRLDKLRRGELEPAAFQVCNAALLLDRLYRGGIRLYLASGTDQADVAAEAEALGYAHCFEGRIFGATGDPDVDVKKVVLETIIREHNLSGHHFATFGDGPVEMRQTQRRGGLCIGVASDEVRRFGLNPSKRRRLIRAGANLIIPDYSQLPILLRTLRLAAANALSPASN